VQGTDEVYLNTSIVPISSSDAYWSHLAFQDANLNVLLYDIGGQAGQSSVAQRSTLYMGSPGTSLAAKLQYIVPKYHLRATNAIRARILGHVHRF
jgi:hypothetical protein